MRAGPGRLRLRLFLYVLAGLGSLVAAGLAARRLADPGAAERAPMLRAAARLQAEGRYDEAGFARLGEPAPGDWRFVHPDVGQRVEEFERSGHPRKTRERAAIVLRIFGRLDDRQREAVGALAAYAGAFFGADARVETGLPDPAAAASGGEVIASAILERLAHDRPADALVAVGLTGATFDHAFGYGRLGQGVAVCSLGAPPAPPLPPLRYLRQVLKLFNHEVGHALGLPHCTFYRCSMNGANSRREMDGQPLDYCPVCLHKLEAAVELDPLERYRRLGALYRRLGLDEEAGWTEAQARHLEQAGKRAPWSW